MENEKKGLLIGIVISVLLMFVLLSSPMILIFFMSIFFTLIFYFFILDSKEKRKKARWYIITYLMITGIVFGTMLSAYMAKLNHEGNTFYETTSTINEGSLYGFNWEERDVLGIPDNELFKARTNYFGGTQFNINLDLNKGSLEDFKRISVKTWYYYDSDIDEMRTLRGEEDFIMEEQNEGLSGNVNINFTIDQYSHHHINYLFRIYLYLEDISEIDTVSSRIVFNANISAIYELEYSYYMPSFLFPGDYNEPSQDNWTYEEEDTDMNILSGAPIIFFAAFILLLSYLFLLGLGIIWQKFDIMNFMIIVYAVIAIILLFWYISWGLSGHATDMGLPEMFNAEEWIFGLTWLRNIIIIIIGLFQWLFSVGTVLGIMMIVTIGFSRLFAFKQSIESFNEKMKARMEKIKSKSKKGGKGGSQGGAGVTSTGARRSPSAAGGAGGTAGAVASQKGGSSGQSKSVSSSAIIRLR